MEPGHGGAVRVGKKGSGPAETASDIQDLRLGVESQLIKEILRCPPAPNVKLIDRCKVIDRHRIHGLALQGKTRTYGLHKIAMRVVLRYVAQFGHLAAPCKR